MTVYDSLPFQMGLDVAAKVIDRLDIAMEVESSRALGRTSASMFD